MIQFAALSDPEMPEWLAASTDSRSTKPTSQPSHHVARGQRIHHKQASQPQPPAYHEADASGQELDNSGAEHLLDIWESDSDEPAASNKHRYRRSCLPLHSRVHNYMCKRVLYSAECAMQLFSAAATARVRLSHQHANPVLRITNQSSGRWVTLTVLEPCRNSPQLPGVCAVLSYRLHTLTQTNVRWPDPRLLHAFWQQWLSA